MPQLTAQIEVGFDGQALYDQVRQSDIDVVLTNPIVIMARKLSISTSIAAGWSYVAKDDNPDVTRIIRDNFEPWESTLIRSGVLASLTHGWKPYVVEHKLVDGWYEVTNIGALRHDATEIILDRKSGAFKAFEYTDVNDSKEIRYNWPNAAFVNFDETLEGRIGVPDLKALIDPHKWWRDTNLTANRYDRKLAGGFIILYYPVGSTVYNGVLTANDVIADDFLTALQSSGSAKIPVTVKDTLDQLSEQEDQARWRFEIVQASSGEQTGFVNRLKYLDACMLRALGWTERAVVEGQFGTKAEAGEHADMALLNMHTKHQHLVSEINEQMVKPLLNMNFGNDACGSIQANELSDAKKAIFRSVLSEIMTNPVIGLEIAETLDHSAILDTLGLPIIKEETHDAGDTTGAGIGGTAGAGPLDGIPGAS